VASLFFSYSHADEQLRDRLEVHLAMLKREGLIATWHDRRITPGVPIDRSISDKLEAAEIILLLVSPDFLASDYCYDVEMTRALERHKSGEAAVIPIILRPCDWHGAPFGRLKALPTDGKPVTKWADADDAFLDIVRGLREVFRARGAAPAGQREVVPTTTVPRESEIRSSNLRVAKIFNEREKDEFLHEGFEYIARYFENSLDELGRRNPEIEGRFRRIDANRFTAVAYRGGQTIARCTVWLGGLQGRSIAYSNTDSGTTGGFNESLSVTEDDQALHLESMGLSSITSGGRPRKLAMEGGAELLWSLFIEPLQRK
jgi:hypothetical protein